MAEYIQLDEFDLSAPESDLSLSVWPNLFVSDAATSQLTLEELHGLVQAGQHWFLSPSICHFQIIVQFEGHSMNEAHRKSNILEFLEFSICLSTVSPFIGFFLPLLLTSFSSGQPWDYPSNPQNFGTTPSKMLNRTCVSSWSNPISLQPCSRRQGSKLVL
jgi:hypothetical protein